MRPTLLLILVLFPLAATAVPTPLPIPPPTEAKPAEPAADAVPLAEIQRYVAVYRAIKDAYVEPIGDQALMKAALRGLLADLDPHSAYLEAEEAEALLEQTGGTYAGIGVEIEQRPDRSLLVVAPIDDTPA